MAMAKHLAVWAILALLLAFVPACGGSGAVDEPEDKRGQLGEACRDNGSCNEGLICTDNLCRFPAPADGDEDLDPDVEPDVDEAEAYECYRDTQCPPDHICDNHVCVEIVVDGDEDFETDGDGDGETDTVIEGPALSVFPPSVNFGSVPVDQKSERAITLQNIGTETLTVQAVEVVNGETDQGLFKLSAPVSEFSLTVGESISITLEFSRSAEGAAQSVLRIDSDSVLGEAVAVPLVSDARSRVSITVEPDDLNFGAAPLKQLASLPVTITNALLGDDVGDLILEKVEIVQAQSVFAVGAGAPIFPKTLGPGVATTLPLTAFPADAGELTGSLLIYHNDPSKPYPLELPLYVLGVVPDLEIDPAILPFGPVAVGDTRTALLTLRNHGGDTVVIDSMSFSQTSSSAFSYLDGEDKPLGALPAQIAVGEYATIQIVFSPDRFGEHAGALYIRSNDPASDVSTLTVSGQAIPPELSITPGSLDFGCVQIGQQDTRTLTITYQGEGEIGIQDALVATAVSSFTISAMSDMPLTLGTGDSTEIEVTFEPGSPADSILGRLVVVIGNEDTISFNIDLLGCAVAATIQVEWDENGAFIDVQRVPNSIPAIADMNADQLALWAEREAVGLSNDGTAPLHISSIRTDAADTSVWAVDAIQPLTIAPGESTSFDVLFAPRAVTNYTGRVIICSDGINTVGDPELCETEGHAPVVIEIPRLPIEYELFVEPLSGSINFGEPEPGESVTAQVILKNVRPTVMHIDRIDLEGSEAALGAYFIDAITPAGDENGWDLAGGPTDQIAIDLRFEPPGGGALSAALAVRHNDKDAHKLNAAPGADFPVYNITLSGNGMDNTPPVAIIKSPAGQPEDPLVGARVRAVIPDEVLFLDGSSSFDPDEGDFIASYKWSIEESDGYTWYDSLTVAGPSISFDETGIYHISLEVTDGRDAASAPSPDSKLEVRVQLDPIPIAQERGTGLDSVTAFVRTPLLLDGSQSWDPDGQIVGWSWYWRNHDTSDEPQLFSTIAQPSITFDAPGSFDLLLDVEDNDGRISPNPDSMFVLVTANDRVKIEASWTNGGNVDLHLIKPGGAFGGSGDCGPANRTPDWGTYGNPEFRNESSNGTQPEVIVHDNPGDGVYTVRAQYVAPIEDCGNVPNCRHFENSCDVCGCDCWAPICYINWDVCCKSCDECINEWVCTPRPASVTFYIYINGEAVPSWTLKGEGVKVDETGDFYEFNLIRQNGGYMEP
jgi:hypothetical protein